MELAGERLLRKPITGIAGCWARAARGQVTAEPTTTLMKSRRLIAHPRLRTTPIFKVGLQQGFAAGEMASNDQFALQKT